MGNEKQLQISISRNEAINLLGAINVVMNLTSNSEHLSSGKINDLKSIRDILIENIRKG